MSWVQNALVAILLAISVSVTSAASLTGTAIRVKSGNTFVLDSEGRQITVNLKGLDAPIGREPFALAARAQLSHLVLGQAIRIEFSGNPSASTVTADAFFSESSTTRTVNRELVRRGFALATGPGAIRGEERKAKSQKIGIHGPSLATFLRTPAGWQVVGNADCIPFGSTATVAQRKEILRLLTQVYAETDRLTLGRRVFFNDPILDFNGNTDVERFTLMNLARNGSFVRVFHAFGGFSAGSGFNINDTTRGKWKVVLNLTSLSSTQPILRLQETSGTDVNGQPIATGVRQFAIEPDQDKAGFLLIDGDSFASGPL